MVEWWLILIWVSLALNFIYATTAIAALYDPSDAFKILPWDLMRYSDMNNAGCIVASIGLFILFPIVWIGTFFYWLFHI